MKQTLGATFNVARRWLCETCLTLVDQHSVTWVNGKPYCRECAQWKLPPILAELPARVPSGAEVGA